MKKAILGVTQKTMEFDSETKAWVVKYTIDGKEESKVFGAKFEAEYFYKNMLIYATDDYKDISEVRDGNRVVTRTQIGIMRAWLEAEDFFAIENGLKDNTIGQYRGHLMSGLTDEEKDMSLNLFNKELIAKIKKRLILHDPTQLKWAGVLNVFKKIQEYAYHKDYMGFPVDFSFIKAKVNRRPKPDNDETTSLKDYKKLYKFYLDEEQDLVLRRKAAICCLNMQLGLRIGELCSVRHSDYDLAKKKMTISRTITRDRNFKSKVGDSTKTGRDRTFDLWDDTIILIKFINDATEKLKFPGRGEFLICPSRVGKFGVVSKCYKSTRALSEYLLGTKQNPSKLLQELNIPFLPSHGFFRKTMTTIVAQNLKEIEMEFSEGLATLQNRLGHKKPSMTHDAYLKAKAAQNSSAIGNIFKLSDKDMEEDELRDEINKLSEEEMMEEIVRLRKMQKK